MCGVAGRPFLTSGWRQKRAPGKPGAAGVAGLDWLGNCFPHCVLAGVGRLTVEAPMRKDAGDVGDAQRFIEALLGGDIVLPEQFYPSMDALSRGSGERALMWAVLTDGIESFRRTAHGRGRRDAEEFREAESWVMATDWNWLFSFVNLCEVFGLAPGALRQALLAWKERELDTTEHRRFRAASLRAA